MKTGTICYATSRGLGHLAHDFFQHGIITDILVVEHGGVPTNFDWYPNAPRTSLKQFDRKLAMDFCSSMDSMLFFETPFHWDLLPFCKGEGIRTALMTMYECTPVNRTHPDVYICPSLLDVFYFKNWSHAYLPIPVEYQWRLRTTALHFLHNGGYLGLRGREGTTLLIDAMAYVKSPLQLTIRCQENVAQPWLARAKADSRIEYVSETIPYSDLYASADVGVFPQKFNGCSLPLQEARAAGLFIITTDRFPTNDWLGNDGALIPVLGLERARIGGAYLEYDEAVINPRAIAKTLDAWYGRDISASSEAGRVWAEENSWERLKPKYLEVLKG